MHDSIASPIGRSWWLILLFGLFAVVFGLIAILDPVRAGAGLTFALGVLALAEAGSALLAAFRRERPLSQGWMLLYALVSLAFGLLAVINPVSMAASLVVIMGLWIVMAGVMRIVFAIRVRDALRNEWLLLLSGVLAVVLGALMLFVPLAGLIVAVVWIGVGALVYGLLQIFVALRLRKIANE